MSTANARKRLSKVQHLQQLQRWTIDNIPRDLWNTEEGVEGMKNYVLNKWAFSSSVAKDYAMIVRARILTGIKPIGIPVDTQTDGKPLPVEVEEELSVTEIISGYRKTIPPPPQVDHEVIEEE